MSDKPPWVLVADEGLARILSRPTPRGTLEPVHELSDAGARKSETALRRDAFGRRAGGTAAGGTRPSTDTASAGHDELFKEAERFARQVADWLQDAHAAGRFDELHIAAAPRFLGLLRKAMAPALAAAVAQQHDKDWTQDDPRTLTSRFFG